MSSSDLKNSEVRNDIVSLTSPFCLERKDQRIALQLLHGGMGVLMARGAAGPVIHGKIVIGHFAVVFPGKGLFIYYQSEDRADDLLVMRGEATQRGGVFDSKPAPIDEGVKFETCLKVSTVTGDLSASVQPLFNIVQLFKITKPVKKTNL